ncbi:type I glyceraldehyde-3-phosphate dehydrogenase [Helicobacter winghamensis]|mgnify:CR=1 FL=1|uniref:Glyceraldehyde-3-phosphate dehydrogenase n=1 Tax=Helicobacter winghamensis TaxID=157268 RepID=A0A2N3PJW1_9HELI|nr:type I glyceraldehyde-3-phosphate dehydrogenase [Helicobacter winghamensis]PKT77302.1 type I glyceraldehyde-3-phosphate dehydrogenase [Helicobacter winghamensis]PKT81468.1 type I glyceraldehyde-3-phosphate dehydrogenase [Helicobacter winghamensis]PKT81645.1 type I glyceraldehyde-3-phosphate dehydrogenase [Helicobacter winghamensis]
MALKVAVNGTGRIGLCVSKILGERSDLELTAINTTMPIDTLVHLLKYDSVQKNSAVEKLNENTIRIGNQNNIQITSTRDIKETHFGKYGAELVIECTGAFNDLNKANAHLYGGVKRVVISAPATDVPTFVYGVNHKQYQGESVISNASCTTNALAPIAKVLHENFTIQSGLMTTIHSYTNDQNLLDSKHKDLRRARAAALNMIPTSTGAAKAIGLVMPELKGKLNGFAIRVPTPDVSVVDLTCVTQKAVTKDSINVAFEEASKTTFKNLILVDNEKRVSGDFIGSTYSSIFVPDCTVVVNDNQLKVVAWYDNEWGYSTRLVDMAYFVGQSI